MDTFRDSSQQEQAVMQLYKCQWYDWQTKLILNIKTARKIELTLVETQASLIL